MQQGKLNAHQYTTLHLTCPQLHLLCPATLATVDLVCGIITGMRKSRVNLPNRCYHLISRVAHRAFFLDDEERTRLMGSGDSPHVVILF